MAKIAYAMYDPAMMYAEKHIRYAMVGGRWTVFYSAWAFGDDVVIAQEYAALLNERIAVIAAMKAYFDRIGAAVLRPMDGTPYIPDQLTDWSVS